MDLKDLLNRAAENISVSRAFGSAYEKDGVLIIPVALVAGGSGGGEGTSFPPNSASGAEGTEHTDDDAHHGESGTSSGGGFGGLVMPVGAYVVKDEQVRWVPAVNVTVIVVAALLALRFLTKARVKVQRIKHA